MEKHTEGVHCLYVGIAEPLVEHAHVWLAHLPRCADWKELNAKIGAFPFREIGAYSRQIVDGKEPAIVFHTNPNVAEARVREEVGRWSGETPSLVTSTNRPISSIGHRACLQELVRSVEGLPVKIVARAGLTLQLLQSDLATFKPTVVVLDCHGTEEGCLVLEDGRGRAQFVGAEHLVPILDRNRPRVLFLSACHSERVVDRAGGIADRSDVAVVYVRGEEPLESAAAAAFSSTFFPAMLKGEPAGDGFDAARGCVESDAYVGRFSSPPDKTTPADKLLISAAGREVRLKTMAAADGRPEHILPHLAPVSTLPRRSAERFIGRRRELQQVIDALLPMPPGILRGTQAGDHRLVTLTKEGGIGKTALAVRAVQWLSEREAFAAIIGIGCETFSRPDELLSELLTRLGIAPAQQQGDLLALLRVAAAALPPGHPVLIVLDNLDDLVGQDAATEARALTRRVLETLLDASPIARVLCTCRWPLGLGNYEKVLDVPPMVEDEALEVFLAHLQSPAHQIQVRQSWDVPESNARKLIIELAGLHPLSLYLLARQLDGVPGMTLSRLAAEAEKCLMDMLKDPHVKDDEASHRHAKASMTFELSRRHLGEPASQLFERLSQMPSGIWCGPLADDLIKWHELLGGDWRQLIEKELDYFGLVHFEPDHQFREHGAFVMLAPVRQFASEKYLAADHSQWRAEWTEFWGSRVGLWDELLSGRLPDGIDLPPEERARVSYTQRAVANALFERNDANIRTVFDRAFQTGDIRRVRTIMLGMVDFMRLGGYLIRCKGMAEKAVSLAKGKGSPDDLASMLGTLGNVLVPLGDREGAKTAFEEALKIYRRLAAEHPAAFEPDVAMAINNLGNVLSDLGDREGAKTAFEEALKIYRRLAAEHPAAFEPNVAMTLNNLGNVLSVLGDREGAKAAYEEALKIYRRLAAEHPAAFEPDVAMTLNNLGNVLSDLGDREGAKAAYEEALKIYRRLAAEHPAAFEPNVANTLNNLGNVLSNLGDREGAKAAYEEALKIYRRLAAEHPAAFEPDVAMTLNNLGSVLSNLGDREGAKAAYEEALKIYRRLAAEHPAAFEPDVAMTLNNLGNVLSDLGDREGAKAAFEEALKIYRRLAAEHPAAFEPNVATTLNNLGTVLSDPGDREGAKAAFEEALKIYRRLAAEHPAAFEPNVAMTLNNLGNMLSNLGDRDGARTAYGEALEIRWPLAQRWPAAFMDRFMGTLSRYVRVAGKAKDDPWLALWRQLQAEQKGKSRKRGN